MRSHITASPAWKSLRREQVRCKYSPRHLRSSEVDAWITVFLVGLTPVGVVTEEPHPEELLPVESDGARTGPRVCWVLWWWW